MNKKLYIFDLDGTLADVYKAVQKSLNYTRKKLGYSSVSLNEAKRSVGRGDVNFAKKFFASADVEKALKLYRSRHKKDIALYAKPIRYARQLLYLLKRRKKLIAIASNRPRYYSDKVMKKTGIADYVDYVLCADEIGSLKPNPEILKRIIKEFGLKKEEAVFLGDMDIDLETARRAKVDAIYVKGGSSPLSAVKKYKNKKVVSSLREVLQQDFYKV